MAELKEKEEVESQVPPCGRGVYHKVAAPYFVLIYVHSSAV